MRWAKRFICAFIFLIFFAILHSTWRMCSYQPPRAVYPKVINLGTQENAGVAVGRITISNAGDKQLVIGNVRSECSCTGLEHVQNDQFVHFDQVHISPRSSIELAVRVAIREPPGKALRTLVRFSTNDVREPTGEIEIIVPKIVGLSITPTGVVFGNLLIGTTERRIVEVHDDGDNGYTLQSVASSAPDLVQVSLLSVSSLPDLARNEDGTRLVGLVAVVANTAIEGSLDAIVQLHLRREGRSETKQFGTSGRVVEAVSVTPSRIRLPRESDAGLVYTATAICRHFLGKPIRICVESASPSLSAVVIDCENSVSRIIELRLDPTKQDNSPGNKAVKLRVSDGIRDFPITITVDRPIERGLP